MTDDFVERAQVRKAALDKELAETPWAKGQRRRWLIVIIVLILDLGTTGWVYGLHRRSDHQNQQLKQVVQEQQTLILAVQKNAVSIHQFCLDFNTLLSASDRLWRPVLKQTPPAQLNTPQGREFIHNLNELDKLKKKCDDEHNS